MDKITLETTESARLGEKVRIRSVGPSKQAQLNVKSYATISDTQERIEIKTLLDSGATQSCVDEDFVEARQIPRLEAAVAVPVYNADRTLNSYIKHCVELVITVVDHAGQEHSEVMILPIVNLGGKHDVPRIRLVRETQPEC